MVSAKNNFIVSKDEINGAVTLVGEVTFDDLESEPTFTWMRSASGASTYDANQLLKIRDLNNFQIKAFIGTWCGDSYELLPAFRSLLQAIAYPLGQLTLFGMGRDKTLADGAEKKYAVRRLPTIILFDKSGLERGRIEERVKLSLEDDLMVILSGSCIGNTHRRSTSDRTLKQLVIFHLKD